MKRIRLLVLATVAFAVYLTAAGQLISKKETSAIDNILAEASVQLTPGTYIIRNVSILTMNDSVLVENQDVLIGKGIIQKIGPSVQDENATIIDGTGKFLMPGLTDMHVHLFERHPLTNTWMMLLLSNAVTTVRDMCGEPGKLQLRDRIKGNEMFGPNLYQSGPIINGMKDKSGLFAFASSAEQAREIVIAQKRSGYDFIKVYDGLTKEVYAAIVDEARKQGMPVIGHLPDKLTLEEVLAVNHNSIEHLTGYYEWKDNQVILSASDNYASLTAGSNVWNCPTIYNHYMNGSREGAAEMMRYAGATGLLPDGLRETWTKRINKNSKQVIEIVDKYGASNFESFRQIVLSLYHAKAKLIAGTDAGNLPFLVPGYSLHQELKIMKEIGIPTYEVLRMATVNAALAMGKSIEFGTVDVGKRADLLLLNSNPLDNIENLHNRSGMMVRGIWLSGEEAEALVDKIKSTFGN